MNPAKPPKTTCRVEFLRDTDAYLIDSEVEQPLGPMSEGDTFNYEDITILAVHKALDDGSWEPVDVYDFISSLEDDEHLWLMDEILDNALDSSLFDDDDGDSYIEAQGDFYTSLEDLDNFHFGDLDD